MAGNDVDKNDEDAESSRRRRKRRGSPDNSGSGRQGRRAKKRRRRHHRHHHHHHRRHPDQEEEADPAEDEVTSSGHHRRRRRRRRRRPEKMGEKTDSKATLPVVDKENGLAPPRPPPPATTTTELPQGEKEKEESRQSLLETDQTSKRTRTWIRVRKDKIQKHREESIDSLDMHKPHRHKTEEEIQRQKEKLEKIHAALQEKYEDELRAAEALSYIEKEGIPLAKRMIGSNFVRSMRLVIILGRIFGRYPFTHRNMNDGSMLFMCKFWHPFNVYFLIVNILLTALFCAGTWSYFSFNMNLPVGPQWKKPGITLWENRRELRARSERIVFDRHVVFFISIWCTLLHNVLSGWHFQFKSRYIANYLTFWTKAMVTVNMDVTKGVLVPVLVLIGSFSIMSIIFIIMTVIQAVPSAVGGPAILAIIMGREYDDHLLEYGDKSHKSLKKMFITLMYVARPVLLYLFISSKVFMLLFVIICKLLRNAFSTWNGRVYATVLRGGDYIHTKEGRTTYSLLFKDHCALLDLVEGTDRVFSFFLESFFGLHALGFCFEIFFLLHCVRHGQDTVEAEKNDYFTRQDDWVLAIILLVVHIIMFIIVLRCSAQVGEEAMAGLEVIRRKTMLGRKTDEELFFMLSMFSSYTSHKPLGISAGGFFVCSKTFNMGVLATIISYFTIVVQFQPRFDFIREAHEIKREEIQHFINVLEKPVWRKGIS